MKICQYQQDTIRGPITRLGILHEDGRIIDPNLAWACDYQREGKYNFQERANHKCPSSLSKILALSDAPLELFQETYGLFLFLEKVGDLELTNGTPIFYEQNSSTTLAKPIDRINSFRDYYAFEKHVKKGFSKRNEPVPPAWYEMPVYYKGNPESFIGPGEDIMWPSYTDKLDYELELGLVIGKEGKNINPQDALAHIFGLTIINDISARDIQAKEMACRLGPAKGKDFCTVIGPVITTFDEFEENGPNLLMTASINGHEWSRGYSGESFFSWRDIIVHTSQEEWLLPGDLLGSGTVGSGCGLELDKWIKEGDTIELYIENIGTLKNKVGKKNGKF